MKTGSLRRILGYTYRYRWSFLISVIGFISFAAADIAAVEWIRRIISYIDSDDESLNTILAMSLIFIAIGRQGRQRRCGRQRHQREQNETA